MKQNLSCILFQQATIFIDGLPVQEENVSVHVISSLGKRVFSMEERSTNAQLTLDVSSLLNGIYTLVITQKNVQVRRVISIIN
jgi:hypothetical protein